MNICNELDLLESGLVENRIIKGTPFVIEKTNNNYIDKEQMKEALYSIEFDFKEQVKVYTVDYQVYNSGILGLALPTNEIILFDFIPYDLNEMYQNVVTHEFGHLVYMDMTKEQQEQYKQLRGIPEEWDNYPRTPHNNRPQEIFAEDFRMLFGGETARKNAHFNFTLKNPGEVAGLKEFIKTYKGR